MGTQKTIHIDPLSCVSLLIDAQVNNLSLGGGTGFIVQKDDKFYLITNWHVVSGRNTDTGECLSKTGGLPDSVVVAFHVKCSLGSWVKLKIPILDGEKHLWIEHPKHTETNRIDVVAIPLKKLPDKVTVYPLDLNLADTNMLAVPASSVSIIGFPFGLSSAGAFPIWKTGHIASDPDLDYNGLPVFLIDATTRSGMSGSPVVMRANNFTDREGGFVVSGGPRTLFLGVYSGRIRNDIEIGRVWKPEIIKELLP